MGDSSKKVMTLANQLTLFRMLLVPVFVILVIYQKSQTALYVFILAGITDGLDGLVARVWRQKTALGALLDPMADKLLLVSSFLVFSIPSISQPNPIPLWLTVIVISRDVLIGGISIIIYLTIGKKDFTPSLFGKLSTIFQIATIFFVLLNNYFKSSPAYLQYLFFITLFLTLLSGLHYLYLTYQWVTVPQRSENRE